MLCDFKGYVNNGHDLIHRKCLLLEPCMVHWKYPETTMLQSLHVGVLVDIPN